MPFGVHVTAGAVVLTPWVAHTAEVSNAVLDTGVSIPVTSTDEILVLTTSVVSVASTA